MRLDKFSQLCNVWHKQSSGQRMIQMGRQAGTQTGRNIASGIQSAVGQVGSAMDSLVNAAAARANAGVGRMRAAGAQIGNGLAQGMLSALGAVTAAANALVAQAERAAQAAAKIHSPSRLFRDNVGIYIGQGLAVGIDKSVKFVKSSIADMIDTASRYAISAVICSKITISLIASTAARCEVALICR